MLIYQRNFKKDGKLYHHIMDIIMYAVDKNLALVTVIAENGDMHVYVTALSVMGEEKAIAFQNILQIQIILIRKDVPFTNLKV